MSSMTVLPFDVVEFSSLLTTLTVTATPQRAVRVHRFHVSTKREPDPIWQPSDSDWEALDVVYDHIEERYGCVFTEADLDDRARNALSWHPPVLRHASLPVTVAQDEALDRLRAMVTPFPAPHPWIALTRFSDDGHSCPDAAGFDSLVFEQVSVGNVLVTNGEPIPASIIVGETLTIADVQPGIRLSVVLRDDSDVAYQIRMMAMCELIR